MYSDIIEELLLIKRTLVSYILFRSAHPWIVSVLKLLGRTLQYDKAKYQLKESLNVLYST